MAKHYATLLPSKNTKKTSTNYEGHGATADLHLSGRAAVFPSTPPPLSSCPDLSKFRRERERERESRAVDGRQPGFRRVSEPGGVGGGGGAARLPAAFAAPPRRCVQCVCVTLAVDAAAPKHR